MVGGNRRVSTWHASVLKSNMRMLRDVCDGQDDVWNAITRCERYQQQQGPQQPSWKEEIA